MKHDRINILTISLVAQLQQSVEIVTSSKLTNDISFQYIKNNFPIVFMVQLKITDTHFRDITTNQIFRICVKTKFSGTHKKNTITQFYK